LRGLPLGDRKERGKNMKITHEIKRVRLTEEEFGALYTAVKAFDTLCNNISHGEPLICEDGTVIPLEGIGHIADAISDALILNGNLTIEDPPKNEGEDII
jgi:hypothetical protein